MRKVAQIMGMPISIDIPSCEDLSVYESCFNLLRQIDQQFSPYKPDSELSRYINGQIDASQLSSRMRSVITACAWFEEKTDGYFSANYKQQFDPSGYVKGWAIQEVSDYLQSHGYTTYSINAGGDVLCKSNNNHVWKVGIQHPTQPGSIVGTVEGHNLAVATSGNYERGDHIVTPDGQAEKDLISVTVIGKNIINADVFATTVFAMGSKDGNTFINNQPGYQALLIDRNLNAVTSDNFAKKQISQLLTYS